MKSPEKRTGRPRAFNSDEALNIALRVFWTKGYEGASLTELTEAMGINRPSLYATFGNKEELFKKALDKYAEKMAPGQAALDLPSAREAVEAFLTWIVESQTDPNNPPGCLAVQGALVCGSESEAVRQELCRRREAGEATLCQRLKRARDEGDLPEGTDPAELARFYTAVLQGLAVQAVGGANREDLMAVVKAAMRAWPG